MAKHEVNYDALSLVPAIRTAAALMIGNAFLVLLGVVGNGDELWRLTKFITTMSSGVIILLMCGFTFKKKGDKYGKHSK